MLTALDALVSEGMVSSRSDAVRLALEALIDRKRRDGIGLAMVEGYRHRPQTDREVGWSDQATVAMIAEEAW